MSDDEAMFVSASTPTELLSRLQPGAAIADLNSGIDHAFELLENSDNLNREIYLITDRQRRNLPEQPLEKPSDIRVCFIELPLEPVENCGITSLDFGGRLLMPGHEFELSAVIKNYGSEDRDDLIASLYMDGNRVSQTDVRVEAGQEAVVRFTRTVSYTGFHSGWVELSDDKFAGDNRFYFSLHIPDRFNVLVIRGDAVADFVSLALSPSPGINQYWSVKQTLPDQLSGINFRDYDVIVLAGAPRIGDSYIERLWSFVDRGKSLFVTYSADTDIDYFNSKWAQATGITFDQAAKKSFTRAGYYTFSSVNLEHPIFSVFGFREGRPPEVKFYTLPRLSVAGDTRVLLRFTGDRPALVENRYGNGHVLTFTGPMAPTFSDLTGHAFFVPFVSRIIEYLAADLSTVELKLLVGDPIVRSVNIRGSVQASLLLQTPDSSVYSIPPEEESDRLVFRPMPTDQPGIYRVSYLGQEVDRFALNINPAESDLTAVDSDQMKTALGLDESHQFEPGTDLAAAVSELRFGKELWQLLLWIVAGLLLAEMLLARGSDTEESP